MVAEKIHMVAGAEDVKNAAATRLSLNPEFRAVAH